MLKGHKGPKHSAEARKRHRQAVLGEKHPMFGKHHTDEAKEKLRISSKKMWKDPNSTVNTEEYRKKLSDANKGHKGYQFNDTQKAEMSIKMKVKWLDPTSTFNSPEYKAKREAAYTQYRENFFVHGAQYNSIKDWEEHKPIKSNIIRNKRKKYIELQKEKYKQKINNLLETIKEKETELIRIQEILNKLEDEKVYDTYKPIRQIFKRQEIVINCTNCNSKIITYNKKQKFCSHECFLQYRQNHQSEYEKGSKCDECKIPEKEAGFLIKTRGKVFCAKCYFKSTEKINVKKRITTMKMYLNNWQKESDQYKKLLFKINILEKLLNDIPLEDPSKCNIV